MPAEEVTQREFDMQMAKLGIEAEAFKRSALGKYLYDRAELEKEQAIKELVLVDDDDVKLNRKYRNQIKVVDLFTQWIDEAINSGNAAAANIENEEAEEN